MNEGMLHGRSESNMSDGKPHRIKMKRKDTTISTTEGHTPM